MMDGQRALERSRQGIIRLCHAGLDSRALRREVLRRLDRVMPIDAAFFATADPATLLFTSAVTDELLRQAAPRFLANEFFQDDVNKFVSLARSPRPVGDLDEMTAGQWERSPRFREILAPLALGDELRAALVTDAACWGFLCLHRERSRPGFTPGEADFLKQLVPHLAVGLRKALLVGHAVEPPTTEGPGLLVLANDLSLAAITPAAERWLDELAEGDWPGYRELPLPQAVYTVAARLRALGQPPEGRPELMPRARLRTAAGRWLVLHASWLAGPSAPGQIAVILEEARPAEIAPLIVQAYTLSKREGEITRLVARGLSTAEIAAAVHISANTVQDHLKAIFDKVGVRSRRELVSQLFAQQYHPRMAAGSSLTPDGWFAPDQLR